MRLLRALCLLLVTALLAAGLAGCDSNDPPPEPDLFPQNALYVCNQADATISVISTETNDVVRTLDLRDYDFPGSPTSTDLGNAKPHHVVVEPDGSAFYVSLIGLDRIAKFDRRGRLAGTASFEAPGMLALSPTRDVLYAGHTMSIVDVPSTVTAIDRSDMTFIEGADPVEVGISRPHGLGVHPSGGFVYAGSLSENRLATISAETFAVSTQSQEGEDVQRYVHFALSPGGDRLYTTGQTAGTVRTFDVSSPSAPRLLSTASVAAEPWHPVLSTDGRMLYFGNKGADVVTVFDTEAGAVVDVIESDALNKPHGSALAPAGPYLYVSNNTSDGAVVVIDTQARTVVKTIDVGAGAAGLGTRGGT